MFKKIDAYQLKDDLQYHYFTSTVKFKTCKAFKKFLEEKYPNKAFKCNFDKVGNE